MIEVRPERPDDRDAVRRVHEQAFGQPDEADLVDRLRATEPRSLGRGAEADGRVVGHIAFSPLGVDGVADARALAPMAVVPDRQRTGVGSALVRAGLAACRADGAGAVVVLGHPDYYPRFGFARADGFGLACPYDAPPEAFMALELVEGALAGAEGVVRYAAAFGG